jgi:hypothetical protein
VRPPEHLALSDQPQASGNGHVAVALAPGTTYSGDEAIERCTCGSRPDTTPTPTRTS